jgi:transposase
MTHYFKNIAQLKRKGVSNRAIATSLSMSRNTINRSVRMMEASDYNYLEIESLSDAEIVEVFQVSFGPKKQADIQIPNYEYLAKELSKPGVTMQLLWEEYVTSCRLANRSWYRITQFKKYFKEYLNTTRFTDIINHKAGEKIEVDWSGVRPSWKDPDTKEIIQGQLFVGILPFSQYIYAEVTSDMTLANWIKVHINMFNYFGGVARILVPDNLKTGVIKHTKQELILNQTYREMADHYGMVIVPTRVRSPQDKASVEGAVKQAQRQLIARIRNYQFFSIDEVNKQILIELKKLNDKAFQKKEGSRSIVFNEIEKSCLNPLPKKDYEMAQWKQAKVQTNAHITHKKCHYSVPYEYIGKTVKLKITAYQVHIYLEGTLLCSHSLIKHRDGLYSTDPTHMPKDSNAHSEWNKDRYLHWAKQKGPYTYQVILKRFESSRIEQQQYKTVHSILKLADKFTNERLESACQLALEHIAHPSYKNIKGILDNNQDMINKIKDEKPDQKKNRFLRGGSYYE